MEAIEEPPPMSSTEECLKVHTSDETLNNADVPVETDVCHSSNGIRELNVAELKNKNDFNVVAETAQDHGLDADHDTNLEENNALATVVTVAEVPGNEIENPSSVSEVLEINSAPENKQAETNEVENIDGNSVIEEVIEESVVEVDGIVDNNGEHITFETEIFIEGNHDLDEQTLQSDEPDNSNILNEIGQNIELSDALRSSDVSDTVENNNCDQEVFNKEELLDILEGNDIEQSRKVVSDNFLADSKKLEEHLAMQQLNRLKGNDHRKKNRNSSKKVDRKQPKRSTSQVIPKEATVSKDETTKKDKLTTLEQVDSKEIKTKIDEQPKTTVEEQQPKKEKPAVSKPTANAKRFPPSKKESIVNALVKDWSDDEHADEDQTLVEEGEALLENTKTQNEKIPDEDENQNEHNDRATENSAETSVSDETPRGENNRPQRRLTRVIKKKVIFDPDNPDTFTKTKVHIKKEKETGPEKEQSTPKKIKIDNPTTQPLKTKSPVSKMQWKKPTPKNSKQAGKRLTEVDRLLMDEGAVNMICQLTPDALKGNKNMKSKAEYIKNIQSNNPDTKEMKFRERKSKSKSEGDPKKVGSGKDRLSTSVMSPLVSEDFEAHSADDSIIYRRHSSSSYSSTCMSPRRLSDFEGVGSQNVLTPSQKAPMEIEEENIEIENQNHNEAEIFMSSKTSTPKAREIMNKRDCLSIKEKLNSKLSQALNKRKRESIKSETPPKVKKVMQVDEVCTDVTINFNQMVAEICIRSAGSLFSIQIMKVLENILALVDSNKNITVTLITSECGTLCSGLDLKPILDDAKHAQEIADHARSLMRSLDKHSKLVIVGVEGKAQGFSLALAALSDVLLVSEHATFTADPSSGIMQPGAAILNSRGLPQSLLNDLIVFGREVSATEALQGGLVSRVIWPERFQEQVRAIAKDIAAQPSENIALKKQLLSLKKIGSATTFQMCLEKERDLLVKYWTSAEGKELLRANLDVA